MISYRALWQLLHRDCEFRIGSIATETRYPCEVRFPPESDRTADRAACLKGAKPRHKLRCDRQKKSRPKAALCVLSPAFVHFGGRRQAKTRPKKTRPPTEAASSRIQ